MSEGFALRLTRALGGCVGIGAAAGVGWLWGRVSARRPLPPLRPIGVAGVGRLTAAELFAAAASQAGVLVQERGTLRGWSPSAEELAIARQASSGLVGVVHTAEGWTVEPVQRGDGALDRFDGLYRWMSLSVERRGPRPRARRRLFGAPVRLRVAGRA